MKRGLHFQDGTPVSADDAVFSFHEWARKGALDADLLLPIKGVKEFQARRSPVISGIRRTGPLDFEVTLDHWTDSFIRNLTITRFVVYPKDFQGRSREEYMRVPVGTGPYRLVSSREGAGEYERFDRYYMGRPLTERIDVVQMTEPEARRAYRERRVDNLLLYPISNADDLRAEDSVLEKGINTTSTLFIISAARPALRDRELRRAIARHVDKKAIVERCYPDATVGDGLIPPGLTGSQLDAGFGDSAARPDEIPDARRFRSRTSAFKVYMDESMEYSCLGKALTESLKPLGIPVETASFDKMYGLLKTGRLSLWVEDFSFKSEDPISNLQYFSQTSNEYFLGFPTPELQKIFASLQSELTPGERAGRYSRIDSYLTENYFVVPLLYPRNTLVRRRSVKGAEFLKTTKFVAGWHGIYVER